MAEVYIGLGSNMGQRIRNLEQAIKRLAACTGVFLIERSPYYETEPQGGPPQPRYINAALGIKTNLSPHELLAKTQEIENSMGRIRKQRWGPRTVDIDILLYDDLIIQEEALKIPHPSMHLRQFVLEPLCDIAPRAIHPVLGKTASELLESLKAPLVSGKKQSAL